MEGKKRKSDSQTNQKSDKRSRTSNADTGHDPELDEKIVAGLVEKIYVRNFMCHSSFEVVLNRHINFIVGRNGSGKSAILTALMIGLGGKASTTNRGSSIKVFIKKGCHSATIQITLSNVGRNPYKPEVYGDKIIIVRTLSSGSGPSGYRLKTARGELVSNRREELDKIICAFNIQVENPISILNQDVARTFLNNSDPHEKYKIFMRATRMDQVNRMYQETCTTEIRTRCVMNDRKEVLSSSQKEVNELKHKWNMLQSISNYRDKSKQLENELYWAVAVREETLLGSLEDQLKEQVELIPVKRKAVDKCMEVQQELYAKHSNAKVKVQNWQTEVQKRNVEVNKARYEERQKKEEYKEKLKQYKDIKAKVQQHEIDINTLHQEIDKIKNMSDSESKRKRQRIKEEIAKRTEEESKIIAMRKTTELHCSQLMGDLAQSQNDISSLQAEARELWRVIGEKQKRIDEIMGQSSEVLTLYGSRMPSLVQKIEAAFRANKFTKKPIGPIGTFIKLNDPKWAPAVESLLYGSLRKFCVDNAKDAQVFHSILASEWNGERKPGVMVTKFVNTVHDVSSNHVVVDGFSSLLSMLTVSHPVVSNCLIDTMEIETILLIPTSNEAYELMSQASRVPRKCKRAMTLKGDIYYPDPDYRSYAGKATTVTKLLQVNVEDKINSLKDEIASRKHDLANVNSHLHSVCELRKKTQKQFDQAKEKEQTLLKEQLNITAALNSLEDSVEAEPSSITSLISELEICSQQCEKTKEDETQLDADCQALKGSLEKATEQVKILSSKMSQIEEMEFSIKQDLSKVENDIREIDLKLKEVVNANEMHDEKIKHIEIDINKQKDKTLKATDDAAAVCPSRINTKRFPHVIEQELKESKHYVKSVEEKYGSQESVGNAYLQKNTKLEELSQRLMKLEEALESLNHSLITRKKLYTSIQKVMGLRVTYMFQPLLKERNYRGGMDISHQEKTLIIRASPLIGDRETTKDTKSLSGGERSYSTIAFILALWDAVEPPFYFLDEFDVFMDKMNRRVIMELLLTHAKQKSSFQFVFLTPQDTSSIESSLDITIHRMADPERGSTSMV